MWMVTVPETRRHVFSCFEEDFSQLLCNEHLARLRSDDQYAFSLGSIKRGSSHIDVYYLQITKTLWTNVLKTMMEAKCTEKTKVVFLVTTDVTSYIYEPDLDHPVHDDSFISNLAKYDKEIQKTPYKLTLLAVNMQ